MGKTLYQISSEDLAASGPFAASNELWSPNIYTIVYSISGCKWFEQVPLGTPVKDGIEYRPARPIPDPAKEIWHLYTDVDLSRFVFWGLFHLDSVVIMNVKEFGKTIKEICDTDVSFFKWAIHHHHNFYLAEDVIDYIQRNKLGLGKELINRNQFRRKEEYESEISKHPNDYR